MGPEIALFSETITIIPTILNVEFTPAIVEQNRALGQTPGLLGCHV